MISILLQLDKIILIFTNKICFNQDFPDIFIIFTQLRVGPSKVERFISSPTNNLVSQRPVSSGAGGIILLETDDDEQSRVCPRTDMRGQARILRSHSLINL